MTPSPPPPPPPSARRTQQARKKRTKTFTGCWTCRTRKVKCDEAKPICSTCHEKRITCDGYGSRLQWTSPETIASAGRQHDRGAGTHFPRAHPLRRGIKPEPPESVLPWSRIDQILRSLDTVESTPGVGTVGTIISNFGVFNVQSWQLHVPAPLSSDTQADVTAVPETFASHKDQDTLHGPVEPSKEILQDSLVDPWGSPTASEEAVVAWELYNLNSDPSASRLTVDTSYAGTSPDANVYVNVEAEAVPSLALAERSSYLSPDTWYNDFHAPASASTSTKHDDHDTDITPDASWRMDYQGLLRSLEPHIVPGQERFLMDHYRHRVVNLFCVVDNRKSPWKTIHLPLVLQGVGELSFGGSPSRIRNALRYSLYSVSAFYLSNQHKNALRQDEYRKWTNVAFQYRGDAIRLLTSAIKSDLYSGHRPRYKEFLATMLSMITINVMSGDTSTCCMHLNGADQLIARMAAHKSQFSRKAQALHRIYLYLRVIYEATAPRRKSRPKPRQSPMLTPHLAISPEGTTAEPDPSSGSHNLTTSSYVMFPRPERPVGGGSASDIASYELIYGIPQTLLLMLKEAIEVIDLVDEHREKGIFEFSGPLAERCDMLESQILDWPTQDRSPRFPESIGNSSARIIHHQTRAFHNALVVYFLQNVRLLGHRYQRQYVTAILCHIEAIEEIKAETRILAAPLFWPAFIGATEAFEPTIQMRYRRWYDAASSYGLVAVRTGIRVLHQVWEEERGTSRRGKATWRRIVENNDHTLMLT